MDDDTERIPTDAGSYHFSGGGAEPAPDDDYLGADGADTGGGNGGGADAARRFEGLGLGPARRAQFDQLSADDQEHFLSGMENTQSGGHFANDQEADAHEAVMGAPAIPKAGIRTQEDYEREAEMYTPAVPEGAYNPADYEGQLDDQPGLNSLLDQVGTHSFMYDSDDSDSEDSDSEDG